ncbi:MAG: ABC transporter ATP-binding protein [Deltaproteobacteria bacterium]|nr:ABC transporter ATP-binding protein [Deltaproteobacteria bacterium]MBW2071992.1 ABC transporter ATP-binding protein [Deltaproteobacteria bacterium]
MIEVKELGKTFDPESGPVLDNISFSLERGKTMSIIGPSGCGKTTLLYILAGLLEPCSGSVAIRHGSNGDSGRSTAIILQDFGLFPWKTVGENISLAPRIQNVPEKLCQEMTARLLAEMGLHNLANRYPAQLSGGQKQRVAIARALATRPAILLMDEPFSSLDALTREHLQDVILQLWLRRRLTYILVTHSVEEAVFLGERIMILSDRPTRIKATISNEQFGAPTARTDNRFFDKVKEVRQAMEF